MYKDLIFALKFLFVIFIFVYGFASAQLRIFPYNLVAPVVSSYGGYFKSIMNVEVINNEWRWYEEDGLPTGMVINDPNNALQHPIIYTSTADTSAHLISVDGDELHKWTLDVAALWPDQSHVNARKIVPFEYFTLRDFHVFPDGRIAVIVSLYGTTPWGAGLVMMDKDSNVIWAQEGNYYNDLHVDKAGNIYALRHNIITAADDGRFDEKVAFNAPYLQDTIVKLDQSGEILDQYPVVDMLRQSDYKDIMPYINDEGKGDYTHMNALDVVEVGTNAAPYMAAGDIVALIRNIDTLVVIDPVKKIVKWAGRMPVHMPHDIDVLPNGHLLLYDNQGHLGAEGYSRIVELDPESLGVEWRYVGSADKPFESEFWGFQQRLENGNTMSVVPNKARLLEVDMAGEIVMEYYLHARKLEKGISYNPVITSAEKINPTALPFLDNLLQRDAP
jgi:hypothetical protein